jgi:acyl dehydratase
MTTSAHSTRVTYGDDLVVGTTYGLGSRTLSQDEIVAFASDWDPQDFHVDEEIARSGHFGGIIASGIHSIAVLQRMAVDGVMREWAVIAGRSIEDVQMERPVRPGMRLDGSLTVDGVEDRGPDRVLVRHTHALSSGGESVLTLRGTFYMRRRPA